MRNLLPAGFVLAAALFAAPVAATPFAGQTIPNLLISGTSYNVTFFDAPFSTLGALAPTFTTAADANTALSAILASPQYQAIASTANVPGVAALFFQSVIVPFSATFDREPDGEDVYLGLGSASPAPTFPSGNYEISSTIDYTQFGLTVATFSGVNVPEPASVALLSLGLFGLGWARRRA